MPQTPGDKPNLSVECWSLRERPPPEARGTSRRWEAPDQIRAVDTSAGRSVTHLLNWYNLATTSLPTVFIVRPPNWTSVAQYLFYAGFGRRAAPQMRQVFPKKCCRYFSKCGSFRHQSINLTPSKRVKAKGDGPLRLEVYRRRNTPDQNRAIDCRAGKSVTHLLD